MKPRLLFFSNLFPTAAEPYRGLDNAILLHALSASFEIRVLSPRPTLPWNRPRWTARPEDAPFAPHWQRAAYLPKLGSWNDQLMANSVRPAFERILAEFRPEIVLSSWIFPDSCAAVRLLRGRLPLVSIAQGSDIHHYLTIPARRRVILDLLPSASAVITRSGELARLLQGAGFPAGKLRTIYNGVSHEMFQPRDRTVARTELELPLDASIMLFVGNFYPVKNPLLLIRALAGLENSHLVMAGGGPLESQARALASELQLAPRVHFMGRQPPSGIARLMNAADLLALPSQNEGVPNVLLEAFASGLPVAASRVGGIPEVLDQPWLGRLYPPDDLDALTAALAELLAAPRDTSAIRGHSLHFTWEAASAEYASVLNAALAPGPAPS